MSSLSFKNNTLISLLFAVFLITSVNVEHGMGFSAILMLLVSIVGLIETRGQDYPPLQAWEKYWVASLFLFVWLIYVDILRGFGDISDIDSQSRLLLAIPVYLYVRRVGVNLNIVLIGVAIAAIVIGIYAWYQHVELGASRSHGISNPIYYGDIALLIFIFCISGALSIKGVLFKSFLFVSAFFALYAVVSSGTRGGWITIPTLLWMFTYYNPWRIKLWKRLLSVMIFIVLLISAYNSDDLIIKQRVSQAIDNIYDYYTDNKMSSAGYRLEMWKASYLSAKDHNFLGVGENGFRPEVKRLVAEGRINKGLKFFVDPHSQYFNSLLDQGILGVISLLLIFLIPLRVALTNLKNKSESHNAAMFVSAMLLACMEFMLTISAFEIQIIILFFAFSLSIFLGLFTYNRNYI